MAQVRACGTDDLKPGEMLVFDGAADAILICNVDGEFHATQDLCTHDDWSLAEGELSGDVVECSLHWAKFCVRTGEVKAPPASEPLKTYPTEIRGDDVFVEVDSE
ncbi:MAG: non-heme iron oxygenase ferredoxin subunit [Gordonia polyisoprenivorans]|nr:non-heme iron oxygenase ferredoxin subunit [Gordonia polyisoprenivorans]